LGDGQQVAESVPAKALAAHPESAEAVWTRFASDCMSAGVANVLGGDPVWQMLQQELTRRCFKNQM